MGGHGDRVVTLSPPTSEAGVRFPAWPQVGKLVVDCRLLGRKFIVQNADKLYILVSSALPTTHCDMTCTVLKAKPQINKQRYSNGVVGYTAASHHKGSGF